MKKFAYALAASFLLLPSSASADLIYFLGLKPSKPVHLISFDTVTKDYSVVVRRLHPDRKFSLNQTSDPTFDPKTRTVQYIFSVEDEETEISTQYLRTVHIDTKVVTDVEFGYDPDTNEGFGAILSIVTIDR